MPECLICRQVHDKEVDYIVCEQIEMFDILVDLGSINTVSMKHLRGRREDE